MAITYLSVLICACLLFATVAIGLGALAIWSASLFMGEVD